MPKLSLSVMHRKTGSDFERAIRKNVAAGLHVQWATVPDAPWHYNASMRATKGIQLGRPTGACRQLWPRWPREPDASSGVGRNVSLAAATIGQKNAKGWQELRNAIEAKQTSIDSFHRELIRNWFLTSLAALLSWTVKAPTMGPRAVKCNWRKTGLNLNPLFY